MSENQNEANDKPFEFSSPTDVPSEVFQLWKAFEVSSKMAEAIREDQSGKYAAMTVAVPDLIEIVQCLTLLLLQQVSTGHEFSTKVNSNEDILDRIKTLVMRKNAISNSISAIELVELFLRGYGDIHLILSGEAETIPEMYESFSKIIESLKGGGREAAWDVIFNYCDVMHNRIGRIRKIMEKTEKCSLAAVAEVFAEAAEIRKEEESEKK